MKLIVLLKLLTIFEYSKAESIKLATPDSVVELHSDIKFTVTDVSPFIQSRWFDRLDCAIILADDPDYKMLVAQYDTNALEFSIPSNGIPQPYRARIRYSKHFTFIIKRIEFTDKLLKVVCILNYKTGFETKPLQSSIYQVTFVYVNPTFESNTTKEETVMYVPGSRIIIRCTVKSFPKSKINWESSIHNFVHKSASSKNSAKNEYITTSTFVLDFPTTADNGKTVDCVVVPKHGKGLRRRFTLKTNHGDNPKKSTKKLSKTLIGIIVGAVLVGIIIMIIICICVKKLYK